MPENKETLLDRLNRHLFDDESDLPVHFDKDEQEMILRYRDSYVHWLAHPQLSDRDMIEYIKDHFEISEATAYRDLAKVKLLLGNVKSASKEFHRHTANHMIREGYKEALEAKKLLQVKKAMAMIRAGEALVKVNKLDKDESENIPWDDIIPLSLEPTTDISVIGRKPIPNLKEVQLKLRKKYGLIEDVDFTDITEKEDAK